MNGSYDKSTGKLTIQIPKGEKLEAPPNERGLRRHYLACTECGSVQAMLWTTTAFTCVPVCAHKQAAREAVERAWGEGKRRDEDVNDGRN